MATVYVIDLPVALFRVPVNDQTSCESGLQTTSVSDLVAIFETAVLGTPVESGGTVVDAVAVVEKMELELELALALETAGGDEVCTVDVGFSAGGVHAVNAITQPARTNAGLLFMV